MQSDHTFESGGGNCPAEDKCAFKTECMLYASEDTHPLRPLFFHANKGEILTTNLEPENCVLVFQSGFFAVFGAVENGIDAPFGVYSEGIPAGVVELYATEEVSETYDIRTLLPGNYCYMPKSMVKEKLASLPREDAQRIICSALMNQFNAIFSFSEVRGQPYIYDQILALLIYFKGLMHKDDVATATFEITQDEVAQLINANRMAVSRVLRKMQEDGLVDYSYRSITLNVGKLPETASILSSSLAQSWHGLDEA